MRCLYCGGHTRVANSRRQKRANRVWRRRQCRACHTVFTSVETADLAGSVVVRKPAAAPEAFSRDKLLLSIHDSLRHRKTALKDAEGLCDTIIAKLLPRIKHATVEAVTIEATTYSVLRRFDKAAASHYRAFHPPARQEADKTQKHAS